MRVYVVHPGVEYSTADVHVGLVSGLRANGVDVIEGRLDRAMQFQSALYEAGQQVGVVALGHINIPYYASPYILLEAILKEPDLVIVVSAHNFNYTSARALSKAGIKTAFIATESPYFAEFEREMATVYDVVFTNERRCAGKAYFGKQAHYLAHAYNPDVHTVDGPREYAADAVFIGSWFDERRKLLTGVDWTGIDFIWKGYDIGADVVQTVPNESTAAYYRAAKVCLNHHRTTTTHGTGEHIKPGSAQSLGPRAYEISACGAFQLCDDSRAELWDVFGEYAATYRAGDSADLERQVRYWLSNDARREETARAMHAAVQPHSWTARAKQILEVLA